MSDLMSMDDREFLRKLIAKGAKAQDGYFQFAHVVACLLPRELHESLRQLVNGPVWDGDVISKHCRDALLSFGLATRVCHKGEQGYTGAVYFAHTVLKAIDSIRTGQVAA